MKKQDWNIAMFVLAATVTMLTHAVIGTQSAQAQTFDVIYNFTGLNDGGSPNAALAVDKSGNLFGDFDWRRFV